MQHRFLASRPLNAKIQILPRISLWLRCYTKSTRAFSEAQTNAVVCLQTGDVPNVGFRLASFHTTPKRGALKMKVGSTHLFKLFKRVASLNNSFKQVLLKRARSAP